MKLFQGINLPTTLTLTRLLLAPLVLPFLLFLLLPYNLLWMNGCLAFLFILLSATDFFDGYLARRYGQETIFGALLDPIADKFLMYTTLVTLLAVDKIFFYWVIILIGREFFVMGLRLVALQRDFTIPVSRLAKIKTGLLVMLLVWLILNPAQQGALSSWWNVGEKILLFAAISSSVISVVGYSRQFIKRFMLDTQKESEE